MTAEQQPILSGGMESSVRTQETCRFMECESTDMRLRVQRPETDSGSSAPPAQNLTPMPIPAKRCADEAIAWLERMGPFDPGRLQALIRVMTWVLQQHDAKR